MENKQEMNAMIMESLAFMVLNDIIEEHFQKYCEQYLNGECCNCANCKFNFCKSESECKAMYLMEALKAYNNL